MIVRAAYMLEAVFYVFGGLIRCLVFTVLDCFEWCAKWTR
jgi:hypothetical protein